MTIKEMIEQEPTVKQSIQYELALFEHTHGCLPEKIFVSFPLHDKIMSSYRLYPNRREIITLCGIPVQPYTSDEVEFYLAERKGNLRRFYEDTKQIFMKGEDTE